MARVPEAAFDLTGGWSPRDRFVPELRVSIAHDDEMPGGPYTVGMTQCHEPGGHAYLSRPYVVRCGDGRAVAGHVESHDAAEKIATALNRAYPA